MQLHLAVLDQVEPVCLEVQQKVAQGQASSRRLARHQHLVLEHQQDLEQLVCNYRFLLYKCMYSYVEME